MIILWVLISVILISCVLVFVLLVRNGGRWCGTRSFGPSFAPEHFDQGAKMDGALAKASFEGGLISIGGGACKILTENDSALTEQAGYVHSSFVDTQRLRQAVDATGKAIDGTCYMLKDDRHGASDVFFAGMGNGGCNKSGNPVLAGSDVVVNAWEEREKAVGDKVPVTKCIIEFDSNKIRNDPGVLNDFWAAWGQVDCNQVVAPLRAVNRDMRGTLAGLDIESAGLWNDIDGLMRDVGTCSGDWGVCKEGLAVSEKDWADVTKKFADCETGLTALKKEFGDFKNMSELTRNRLEVNVKECMKETVDLEDREKGCRTTLADARKDVGVRRGTLDSLKQGVISCGEELQVCREFVTEVEKRISGLEGEWKILDGRAQACQRDLNGVRAEYQTHIVSVSNPCTTDLAFTKGMIAVLMLQLDVCRETLRSGRADNVNLLKKFGELDELVKQLVPENEKLNAELSECRRALMQLKADLAACMAKLKGDTAAVQDTAMNRVLAKGDEMVSKAETTVGSFCSRPVVVPDSLTEGDRSMLVADIDNCKQLLATALKERDEWKAQYDNLNAAYTRLQSEYQTLVADMNTWIAKYNSKQECMDFHKLCDKCTSSAAGAGAADPSLTSPYNKDAFLLGIRYWYTRDQDIKIALFGQGKGRITPKSNALARILDDREPNMPKFNGRISTNRGPKPFVYVDVMPSYTDIPSRMCIFWAWPTFKVRKAVGITITIKFDNDFYFWVNNVPVWAGSFEGATDGDRTQTVNYKFWPGKTYTCCFMYNNAGKEGYANVSKGAKELVDAMNNGDVFMAQREGANIATAGDTSNNPSAAVRSQIAEQVGAVQMTVNQFQQSPLGQR